MRFSPIPSLVKMVLIIICLYGCTKPQRLQYLDVGNFKVDEIGSGGAVISADLKYFNPNNFKMQLKQASLDVYVNDKFMGSSSLDTLFQIPKKDTFYLPVKLKMDYKNLATNALAALMFSEVNLKVVGSTKVGKGGVFMKVPILYEGKQKLSLFK